jgi:AcrR family transcriptional regulator
MPTGIPIPDIREQLLDAAERVLLRDGPDRVTSRAVTTEAEVAKGMLHRHFPDFDALLAAMVVRHIERLDAQSAELRASAGAGALDENLASALADALDPAVSRIISLVLCRGSLLQRLRLTTPAGIPLLAETTKMIAAYLTAERGLGRVALAVDVDTLAVMLVGGAYLLTAQDSGAIAGHLHDLVRVTLQHIAPQGAAADAAIAASSTRSATAQRRAGPAARKPSPR